MKVQIARLGYLDYAEALKIQEKLLELCKKGKINDTFLLVEHPPVLTLGRRGKTSNILIPKEFLEANGVRVYEVNRGGDVTYHGPGQIVGYPIMNLNHHGRDIKDFVWKVEEVFIHLLKEQFNLEAYRDEKTYTGVWVGNDKITAIGIAVKQWVTMHGFAFNVNTNLNHYKWINPCGITDKGVTSLQKLMDGPQDFDRMNELVVRYFCDIFDMEPEWVGMDKLMIEE